MKLLNKLIIWIVEKWFKAEVMDYFADKALREEDEKHWFKARRAGYKRNEMGFYYADLQKPRLDQWDI